MTVIPDPHNHGRYGGKPIGSADVKAEDFADLWSRLAKKFKGNDKVVFGLMNEPHDRPSADWLAAANAALASIRAAGAANIVTVPGNAWTGAHSWLGYGVNANGTVMKGVVDGWIWWAAGPWWGDGYSYSIEPSTAIPEKPQMTLLKDYLR